MAKKAKEGFDWIEWHKQIHNSRAIDPQYAEIIHSARDIIYTFRLNAVQQRNVFMMHPTKEKILNMTKDVTGGFASSLEIFCPKLEIIVGTGTDENVTKRFDNNGYVYLGEIATRYTAKTSREINKIQKYLTTILTDYGIPKKKDTFFCYD